MTDTPETPETEVPENTAETPVERPRRTLSLGGSRAAAPVEETAPEETVVAPVAEDDDHGVDTTAEDDDEDDDGEPIVPNGRITLQELNEKTPEDLVAFAEGLDIENAGNLRKQDLLFAILKTLADEEVEIIASGVLEILPDGFGFLRSPDANYLPGPDDVYVSPSQIRRFGLRSGDTVHGAVRGPREGERYFALLKVDTINFEDPEMVKTKVLFDNLTPLYPEERLHMEIQDPTLKDRSGRVIDIVAPLGKGQRCLIVAPPRCRTSPSRSSATTRKSS